VPWIKLFETVPGSSSGLQKSNATVLFSNLMIGPGTVAEIFIKIKFPTKNLIFIKKSAAAQDQISKLKDLKKTESVQSRKIFFQGEGYY
jgi:hypothetical protein